MRIEIPETSCTQRVLIKVGWRQATVHIGHPFSPGSVNFGVLHWTKETEWFYMRHPKDWDSPRAANERTPGS